MTENPGDWNIERTHLSSSKLYQHNTSKVKDERNREFPAVLRLAENMEEIKSMSYLHLLQIAEIK